MRRHDRMAVMAMVLGGLALWSTPLSAVAPWSALATAWPRKKIPPAIPAMASPFLTDRFIVASLRWLRVAEP